MYSKNNYKMTYNQRDCSPNLGARIELPVQPADHRRSLSRVLSLLARNHDSGVCLYFSYHMNSIYNQISLQKEAEND